jgi:hypothetical protein
MRRSNSSIGSMSGNVVADLTRCRSSRSRQRRSHRIMGRMRKPPAGMYNARLSFGRRVVSTRGLVLSVAAGVFLAMALSTPGRAEPPDISAQRLLTSWREGDPGTKMLAEVIASAFASGMSWAGTIEGHPVYCPPSTAPLTGNQLMSILERFVSDNPTSADKTYGFALSASLTRAFPCRVE